jgi:cell division protease FtsH
MQHHIKVTIVPRGQSLGAAYLPEERLIVRADQMLTKCAPLWEAEQVTFGRISTGALSDLEK